MGRKQDEQVLIMEKKTGYMVGLTAGGSFIKALSIPHVDVGATVCLSQLQLLRASKRNLFKVAAGFAAVFICFLVVSSVWLYYSPVNATILTIDINPSLEMHLSSAGQVISTVPLNDNARDLLERVGSTAGKSLPDALETLLESANLLGYLSEDSDNLVVASIFESPALIARTKRKIQKIPPMDIQKVQEVFYEALVRQNVNAFLAVDRVQMDEYNRASAQGVSVNKLVVAALVLQERLGISVDEIIDQPLGQIIRESHMTLQTVFEHNAHTSQITADLRPPLHPDVPGEQDQPALPTQPGRPVMPDKGQGERDDEREDGHPPDKKQPDIRLPLVPPSQR